MLVGGFPLFMQDDFVGLAGARRNGDAEATIDGAGFEGLSGGTFEFTTATGGGALRAQIERRAGLAAGPAQQSDINLSGRTVPVPARAA